MSLSPLDKIDKDYIVSLVENKTEEDRTLDYKRDLPRGTDDAKKNFLKDVSAMANAAGGLLVYGIEEETDDNGKNTGKPKGIVGLGGINVEDEVLRLQDIIRNGIEPRIPGTQVEGIEEIEGGPVVFIRTPKSWVGPHMIKKGDSRFWSRMGAQNYNLDVQQIRDAFALSESLPQRIRQFRDERLGHIIADETPVALLGNPKTVLHLVPFRAFEHGPGLDPYAVEPEFRKLEIAQRYGFTFRLNFDGLFGHTEPSSSGKSHAFIQLYRSGIIEMADAYLLKPGAGEEKRIKSRTFEDELISALESFVHFYRNVDVEAPVYVMLSLLGVQGHSMAVPNGMHTRPTWLQSFDKDILVLPETIVEDLELPAHRILKESFDMVWQSCGLPKSPYYDKDGNRT